MAVNAPCKANVIANPEGAKQSTESVIANPERGEAIHNLQFFLELQVVDRHGLTVLAMTDVFSIASPVRAKQSTESVIASPERGEAIHKKGGVVADKKGYIYILFNKKNGTLYVGVTSDLQKRIAEHKAKIFGGFTTKYDVDKLGYFEEYNDIVFAIEREKQLKGGNRKKKVALIESMNPEWRDLSEEWE